VPSKAENARRLEIRRERIARAKAEGKNPVLVVTDKRNARRGKLKDKAVAIREKNERAAAKRKKKVSQTCGKAGGRRKDGGRCSRSAGWGTDHPGTGRCLHHGGANPLETRNKTPNQKLRGSLRKLPADRNHVVVDKEAPRTLADARQLLGIPVEMNPLDALMWCIRITAGEIVWYSERMGELSEDKWIEDTFVGKQLHLYARNRTVAIDRLAKYSKWAVDSGIAERAMRLAESYGEQLYQLLHGVLEDLDLSPSQRQAAPEIITRHLMGLEKKNIIHTPNQLVAGVDPDTIVIEANEISSNE
jgi:hypothetical protein